MALSPSTITGLISIQPLLEDTDDHNLPIADDSSLGLLLQSLAHLTSLSGDGVADGDYDSSPGSFRIVACTRWTRAISSDEITAPQEAIRADLARLIADLEDEYERLQAR